GPASLRRRYALVPDAGADHRADVRRRTRSTVDTGGTAGAAPPPGTRDVLRGRLAGGEVSWAGPPVGGRGPRDRCTHVHASAVGRPSGLAAEPGALADPAGHRVRDRRVDLAAAPTVLVASRRARRPGLVDRT